MRASPSTILYVSWAPFVSGAERALLALVQNVDRARYRPVVAVGTDGELLAQLRAAGIEAVHVEVSCTGRGSFGAGSRSIVRLAALAVRHRAMLIHANDVPSFQPAGYAARVVRLPAITHVRFPDTRSGYGWFLKPGFRRAVFVSAAAAAEATAEAGDLFEGRSEVVYDGVTVPLRPSDEARARLREELGLPADDALVVLSGQVSEVKGIWEYLSAARTLVSEGLRVHFVVLGDDLKGQGALRRRAEAEVATTGLSRHVTFLGFRTDAARLMPAFDVVAVPSHVEPLGLSALEGMAAARPVVGSRTGGIAETVVDGVTGTLVPVGDAAALARGIGDLVRAPDRARSYGLAGWERVGAHFSVRTHVERMCGLYDRLLGVERVSVQPA